MFLQQLVWLGNVVTRVQGYQSSELPLDGEEEFRVDVATSRSNLVGIYTYNARDRTLRSNYETFQPESIIMRLRFTNASGPQTFSRWVASLFIAVLFADTIGQVRCCCRHISIEASNLSLVEHKSS